MALPIKNPQQYLQMSYVSSNKHYMCISKQYYGCNQNQKGEGWNVVTSSIITKLLWSLLVCRNSHHATLEYRSTAATFNLLSTWHQGSEQKLTYGYCHCSRPTNMPQILQPFIWNRAGAKTEKPVLRSSSVALLPYVT